MNMRDRYPKEDEEIQEDPEAGVAALWLMIAAVVGLIVIFIKWSALIENTRVF